MHILLVDDHTLFREGLKTLVARLPAPANVHEAGSVEAGLALHQKIPVFSLILLDLNLPGANGLDGIRLFQQKYPSSPVVIVSGVDDDATVAAVLHRGAQGFISKSSTADVLLSDVRVVLAGGTCWPSRHLNGDLHGGTTETLADSTIHLTPRQIEVLQLLSEGHTNKEIARDLGLSDNTVRTHLAVIFKELGARSRTEATFLARRKGLI